MIRVIGMGPGDIRYVTMDAIEKIKQSKRVIAFGRISGSLNGIVDDFVTVKSVDEVIKNITMDTAILASGDPCFYGILEYLKVKGIEVDEVVPGISSFQYMMTRLKKSWNGAKLLSLHGREESLIYVKSSRISVVLTDKKFTPDVISNMLYNLEVKGRIYAGFNLSYDDEVIIERKIGEKIDCISSLAVVVVENEMD